MNQIDQINQTDASTHPPERSNDLNVPNDPNVLWYVIQTKPCDERRVEIHFLNQEIETFLPLLGTQQYFDGKIVQKIKPLFPNYLFAKLDLELHYYKVKWTRGVSKILGAGNEPVPISEKVVQAIREKVGKDNLVELEEEWKEGDRVQINSGPFKELIGIFQKKISETGRVRILLSLIGVDVPVQISQWQIKKVA
jgi:transcription elongation factor/antiterminator RfaH